MKKNRDTVTAEKSSRTVLQFSRKSSPINYHQGSCGVTDNEILPGDFATDSLSCGLIVYNLKKNILYANPTSENILGISSEIMQQQLKSFIQNEKITACQENENPGICPILSLVNENRQNGNAVLKVYNYNRKKHLLVSVNTTPFYLPESNDFEYVLITIRDVTETVKADEALKKSEKRYRDVINNCGEGIAILQNDYLIFTNPKACEITGYSEKELLSKPLLEFIYPEDRVMLNRIKDEVLLHHQSPPPVQFRFINRLNELKWCECITVFIIWENQPATLNFFRDITRRKLAEMALKESEERYRNFIENYHGIAFISDLFFNIKSIHGSIEEITGYKADDFLSHRLEWHKIIYPKDMPTIEKDNNLLISVPGHAIRRTYRIVRKDGQIRWVNEHIKNKCPLSGKPQAIEGFIEDVTDIKKVEELEYRNRFERLITLISSDFINIDTADIDREITKALKEIGRFAEADRSYVFIFKDDFKHIENTHEWCREGISPQINNCKNLNIELLPWWMNKLKNRENVLIPSVIDLPASAASEKAILQSQEIQSLIVVPMYLGRVLIGFLGFDAVREIKNWSEDTITLLKMVGTIFTNALERKKADEELRKAHDELEKRVRERTLELSEANRELEIEREALQQKNLALKEILSQIDDEKKNMARQIQSNIDRVALPLFDILDERVSDSEKHYLRLLKNCISDLSSPFISCLEMKYSKLTPRETEICQMIKNGFSSKQIARAFNISLLTILKQRKTIRKKLKIANKKINLASYLKTLK
ncbi:MAG: PAS domain S-box protein [candidate division Zixibacteria bacterium]|nr:PAS domain S-box protein [candidate division Zixibacteria bacterium]